MQINKKDIRYTWLNKRKHYFVSDIEKTYGEAFVNHMKINKGIVYHQVKHNNNSQRRRLVTASDLENLCKGFTVAPKKTKNTVKKTKQKIEAQTKTKTETKLKTKKNVVKVDTKNQPKAKVRVLPKITAHSAARKVHSLDKTKEMVLRKDIQRLCKKHTANTINNEDVSSKDIEASDRWVYREAYLMLYREFDRVTANLLKKSGKKLEDIGLGYKKNTDNVTYIDRVVKAGLLSSLHNVAQVMFGKN